MKAGVSVGTVSAVLNDRPTVRDKTRQRVLEAVSELGYQPSPSARILRSGAGNGGVLARCVGLLIKEMDNPFYAEIVSGARSCLQEKDYLIFTCTSEGDYAEEGRLLHALRERFVQGAIIAPVRHEAADLSHLFMLKRTNYPFVVLEEVAGLQVHSVSVDNVKASQMAIHYLFETGHERIAHLAGPAYTQHTWDRIRGVERAFGQSRLVYTDDMVVAAGAHFEDGYQAAMRLFRDRDAATRPTAVSCFNDLVAMGALRALAELGLDVPGDVSVVGFDDVPAAAYLSVPLTTVRVPKREMGQRAAEILVQQLENPGRLPLERVTLEAELVVRGSTRPLKT